MTWCTPLPTDQQQVRKINTFTLIITLTMLIQPPNNIKGKEIHHVIEPI
jgi:hypothetical protein